MKRSLKRACLQQLRQTFHVSGFRPGQKSAASCLLSGRDLLCILPTGAGKSLCWQLPAVLHEGLTVVVSPLIALMQDQVRHLHEMGVTAVTINSLIPPEERRQAEDMVRAGKARIVFVSPERLEQMSFWQLCRETPPWLVVVDEAHCIAEWGGEFRPAYSRIGAFVDALAERPVVCAMTATADDRMQRQIASSLRMAFHKRIILPVMRENLNYQVRTTTSRTGTILQLLSARPVRTVVFCRSRARAEQLAAQLKAAGFAAEHYHAGLDREERTAAQQRFQAGETMVLAATTAFGMGIDIPDIRCVIHDALPDSVTELVQQSGRAGRDGRAAECVILIDPGDLMRQSRHLQGAWHSLRDRPLQRMRAMREDWRPLRRLLQVCMTEKCIPAGISAAFGQRAKRCGKCSACLRGPLMKRLPGLPYLQEEDVRLWLLRWQRDAIAQRRGAAPREIMDRHALRTAAHSLRIPDMECRQDQQAMERIMSAICRAQTHGKQPGGAE